MSKVAGMFGLPTDRDMDRRKFLFSLSLGAGLFAAGDLEGAGTPSGSRPNIVFLMADDLGYGDMGCYGQQLMRTPRLDRLASEGLRFTQAYAGGPVCTPSRCVLMTGMHTGHAAARDNIPHYPTYLHEEDVTVAEVLNQAGYRCGGVGKWSLGDAGTVGRATNQGFDTWFGYLNQDHAHYYYPEYLDDDEGRLEIPGNSETREHYSHDLMMERALRFIRQSSDQPFFFYGAFTLPHFSSREEDPDGLTVPAEDLVTDMDWDRRSRKYAAMVEMLDRDVGRIVDLIDELGLQRDTLIIFTSDNGGHRSIWDEFDTNGPFRGYKRCLSEGGIRVPFIARWTGVIPAGQVSDEIIGFQDMLPTFAALGGAEIPVGIDGVSAVDALLGGKMSNSREFLYWDYGHCRDRYDQAVRMGRWKGIREGEGSPIQLFDLEADPGERNDIADLHPMVISRIEAIMKKEAVPSNRYPVGEEYTGGPIWKKGQ